MHCCTGTEFWKPPERHTLFEELKRARNALTHPVPYAIETEIPTDWRPIPIPGWYAPDYRWDDAKSKLITKAMSLTHDKPIALFNEEPTLLGREDAEKAAEIMLWHLLSLEGVLFQHKVAWFAVRRDGGLSPQRIVDVLNDRQLLFEKEWAFNAAPTG